MSIKVQSGSIKLNGSDTSGTIEGETLAFRWVKFPSPFPKGSDVVVIPMVQAFSGLHTPGITIDEIDNEGFKVSIGEKKGSFGWMAYSESPFTPSTGSLVVEPVQLNNPGA
jgi:hypothetical protein